MATRQAAGDLAASDLLAGLDPLARRTALAVLMRGPVARLDAGRTGPLVVGTAGVTLVKSGRVRVMVTTGDGRPLVLAEASDGEMLTCAPVSLPDARVELEAITTAWLCPIDDAHLADLAGVPGVLANFVRQCALRAEEAQATAIRLAHRRVEDRVLLALRAIAERDGRATTSGPRIDPVSHREVARLANVTRPGATQALARLESDGYLVRDGSGWVVPNDGETACAVPPAPPRRGLSRILGR
jgi:CRP-like cAMP-binding protein